VSRAPHLQGQAVPTVMRFSNSSGNPGVHDGIANARALAAKFQLPDRKNAEILALHIQGFPARTPDEFLAFLRAQLPDPATGTAAPDAVPRFLDSHPATRAFIERLTQKPVPASYGRASYYAEHALNSLPRMAPADSAAIAGYPKPGKPISPLMMRAHAARTSCARSWRAA
jgi:catalase